MGLHRNLAILGLAAALAGCATKEVLIPVPWPDQYAQTLVVHNRQAPDVFTALFGTQQLDYTVPYDAVKNPDRLAHDKTFVAAAEKACHEFVRTGHPSVLADAAGGALIFGSIATLYGPLVSLVDSAFHGVEGHNSAAYGSGYALGGAATAVAGQTKRNLSFYECGTTTVEERNENSQPGKEELHFKIIRTVSY